jgi:hypothetical protein
MRKGFAFRGLEIHTRRVYQMNQIEQAIAFCKKFGLNTLILHQNDLVDMLVLPRKYVSEEQLLTSLIIRGSKMVNDRYFFKNVVRKCHAADLKLFFETKEFYYGDGVLQDNPQVFNSDGSICCTDPFWFEFLEEKMRELFEEVLPDLDGIIVSPGTRESMVAIVKNKCKCERCKHTDLLDWYVKLLKCMYGPMHKYGKTLMVRDFSFSRDNAEILMDAAVAAGEDIVMALKYKPQDYFPTFPDNPKIGDKHGHKQVVEYDTNGQFFGLGFFACSQVEDFQRCLQFAFDRKVDGVWLRTDWDNGTETSSFNSMTQLNLIGGAMLANDLDTPVDDIYKSWCEHGLMDTFITGTGHQPMYRPSNPEAWKYLKEYMKLGAEVINKAIYVRGNLFHHSSRWPLTMRQAENLMLNSVLNSYEDDAHARVAINDANIEAVIKEKEEALADAKKLPGILQADKLGFDPVFTEHLKIVADLWALYAEGWLAMVPAYFRVRKAELTKESTDIRKASEAVDGLERYGGYLFERVDSMRPDMPHYFTMILDDERIKSFVADCRAAVEKIKV